MQTDKNRQDAGLFAINAAMASNICLAAVKTLAGIIGNSHALLAEGINSTSDVAYNVIIKILLRLSGKPADESHPYGHSQFESIAALVAGSFVITTGVAVFWKSMDNVYGILSGRETFGGARSIAIWIIAATVIIKTFLAVITAKIGRGTRNPAVTALAYDHRNDVLSAIGAGIGILMGRMGLPWGDPLAGGLVSILILATGIEILKQSSENLMDTVPGEELNSEITALASAIPGVKKIDEIMAHRFGPYLVLNIAVGIEGSLPVHEGHDIASRIERVIYQNMSSVKRVHVHYHPARDRNRRAPGRNGEGSAPRPPVKDTCS